MSPGMPDSDSPPLPQNQGPEAESIAEEETLEEKQRRESYDSSVDSIAILKESNKDCRPQTPGSPGAPLEPPQDSQSPILTNIYSAASLISSSVSSIIIQPISSAITAATAAQRSRQIDQQLKADFRSARHNRADIFLYSVQRELSVKVINAFRAYTIGYTEDELAGFGSDVKRYLVSVAKELVLILREDVKRMDESVVNEKLTALERQLEVLDLGDEHDGEIEEALAGDPAFRQALQEVWQVPETKTLIEKNMIAPEVNEYFCANVSRFGQPDYKPSREDIHMLPYNKSRQHYSLYCNATLASTSIPTVDDDDGGPEQAETSQPAVRLLLHQENRDFRKWMHHIDNIDAIMAVFDLSLYDVPLPEDSSAMWLRESMLNFQSVAGSNLFRDLTLMAVFVGVGKFEEKVKKTNEAEEEEDGGRRKQSTRDALLGYEGPLDDPVKAKEFIADRFRAMVPRGRGAFFYFMDMGNGEDVKRVISEMRKDLWRRKLSGP